MPSNGKSIEERMASLEASQQSTNGIVRDMQVQLSAIQEALQSAKVVNWPLIIAALVLSCSVIAGIYTSLSNKTELWAAQSRMESMQYVQPIIMSAEQSKVDRSAIHNRLESNGEAISDLRTRQAAAEAGLKERLREIETQALAAQNVINMNTSFQEKINSLMWQKVFGQSIPTSSFHPKFHRED